MNTAKIVLGANRTTQVVKKWHDNVVIAKQYIGPMVSP
jgi:ribosomal protein L30E